MRRLGVLLAALGLALAPLAASAQLLLGVSNAVATGGGGGYTGPGDVVASAKMWVGLRAYSSTQADGAHKAIRVIRASDSQLCDVFLDTSGNLGNVTSCTGAATGSVASFCASTTCQIDIFYDQTGNGNNYSATTSSTRATLSFSCLGSLPCADFGAGVAWYDATITDTAQPLSVSTVIIRTGAFTSTNIILGLSNAVYFNTAVNQPAAYFGGGPALATALDSTWHNLQFVVNNTSSAIAVDATQNTGLTAGTGNIGANTFIGSQSSGGSNQLNGKLTEIGLWPVAFTGTQQTNLCHNAYVYWGTPTSC